MASRFRLYVGSPFERQHLIPAQAKDPSGGYVKYVDVNTAKQNGLFSTGNGTVHAGVDSKNEVSGARESIRMHSKKQYSTGLFLADITHMPGSACGIWPA